MAKQNIEQVDHNRHRPQQLIIRLFDMNAILQPGKIRYASGKSHQLCVHDEVAGQSRHRLGDLRVSVVFALAIAGVEGDIAVSGGNQTTHAVQFALVEPTGIIEIGLGQGRLHGRHESGLTHFFQLPAL